MKILKFLVSGLILTISACQKETPQPTESSPISSQKKQEIINKIYTQQKEINLCNQQRDNELTHDSANIYFLNDREYLIEIICFLGAYQSNYQYLLFDRKSSEIKVINFATFDNSTDNLKLTNTNTLNGMTDFDSNNQTLILITKSRGLGDCGSFAQYHWRDHSFELKEYRYKQDCDEVYLPPENYPLIYP
ncbi:DUF1176 domain-containing protein [Geminocystis sp. NIES-3709]|uniref:DUF1176 domain-containing protein n=1 Tax=Geminocystis sp. NIES-3709 TaxID=1617448 RepID=UPI0005FC9C67|nr:DUF1176 domain-containing protein [Geminocystis sp. NIES-3709]BAQ63788.1 hypothetical protein GM3709_553 [Geminocystis sp. NIES-3709]